MNDWLHPCVIGFVQMRTNYTGSTILLNYFFAVELFFALTHEYFGSLTKTFTEEFNLIFQIAMLMDRFEHEFENLDVQSQVMEGTMANTSTLTTPQGEVDSLMQQVADEAG